MRTVQAAGAAIFRNVDGDVELLLVSTYGRLNLPKGRLEEGENLYEGAKREVREETGISFGRTYHTDGGYPLTVETEYPSTDAPSPERILKHVTIFVGEYESGKVDSNGYVVTDWENDWGRFIPVDIILRQNLPIMKSQKDIILKAIELYLEHGSQFE